MTVEAKRTWLVTGASRGLGRAVTSTVLDAGEHVVAAVRDPASVSDLLACHPSSLTVVALDVARRADVFAAVARAQAVTGGIDVLVNNAGYGLAGAVEEVSEQQVRDLLDVNLLGALWCVQAVLPGMRERGSGHIFQLSSVAGLRAYPNLGLYCASKWALEGFSDALADEVAPFGIGVTIVEPGEFRTQWSAGSLDRAQPLAAYDDVLAKRRHGLSGAFADVQPGDPSRIGPALLEVLRAPAPPRRLLLGNGAIDSIPQVYQERLAGWAQWEKLARSVDFPA
jgi:NAD(P)-dependent dehydrogenase (short-subunit alcohol dehydrogenase family)